MAAIRNYKLEYAKRKARAAIKAVELKRGKPLSATYRKRLERGLLKGKSVQQARGHRPAEHIERKQKQEARGGLTARQLRTIWDWATNRKNVIEDHDFEVEDVVNITITNGYPWFENYRKIWDETRSTFIKENLSGRYSSRGLGHLQYLADQAKVDDISWLYYH